MHGDDFGFRGIVLSLLLPFLALFLTALLFFLTAAVADNLLLEDEVDRDLVILAEIAGHWDLNHGRVVLEVKEETVEMDVDGASTEVVEDEELLDFANAADGALKHFLDEDALLRVHNLVVTLLELAVDLDVLNVEYGVVAEPFLEAPEFTILDT